MHPQPQIHVTVAEKRVASACVAGCEPRGEVGAAELVQALVGPRGGIICSCYMLVRGTGR